MNQHSINHIISDTGAHSIERFNRTFKHNTMLRLDAMNLDRFKWVDQLKPIIDKYNNAIHNTIEMSPNQAKKPGNQLMVSYIIWNKAKGNRQYPQYSLEDDVGVKLIKNSKTKGYDPKWSKEVYKVTFIKGNDYLIAIYSRAAAVPTMAEKLEHVYFLIESIVASLTCII